MSLIGREPSAELPLDVDARRRLDDRNGSENLCFGAPGQYGPASVKPARPQKLFEADVALTAPGQRFEVIEEEVLGVRTDVFKHRHTNLRDLLLSGSRRYGDADLYDSTGSANTQIED
ncbi:MAG: hypothetical protein M0Z30_04005 [Actinomycetota bacterium]|nr:hypothetical protein [Actinomycetota bacterium]